MARYWVLALIALAVMACRASDSPRTCDELSARGLRELIQQPISAGQVRIRIEQLYGLSQGQIVVDSHDTENWFRWVKDGVEGVVATRDSSPFLAGFDYTDRIPSAGAAIDCLGTPDQYRAYYSYAPQPAQHELSLDLFFLKQGIYVSAWEYHGSQQAPPLSRGIPARDFLFVPIGSPEETLDRLTTGFIPELKRQIKPWPGKWEDLVVEIDPALR